MKYILVDDETQWRDRVKDVIERFNNNKTIQDGLTKKFGSPIQLTLLLEAKDFNNQVINSLTEADIVFMDIRLDGGSEPTGLNHLQFANRDLQRKIVILTNFTGEYENRKDEFPQILEWLNKPLRTRALESIVDRTHIRINNLRAIYHDDCVEFVSNGVQIPYNTINYIFTGGGEVTLVFTDGRRRAFAANLLRLQDFKGRGGLRQVNNGFIINIENTVGTTYWWQIEHNTKQMPAHYEVNSPHLDMSRAEILERNRVTNNYLPIIADMATRPPLT